MVVVPGTLRENYWLDFEVEQDDIEYLYNYLMEIEAAQTSRELVEALVQQRIQRERSALEQQRSSGGNIYFPKEIYSVGQNLIFPAFGWQKGEIIQIRPGKNHDIGEFWVIRVVFENGEAKELACGIQEHVLNQPPEIVEDREKLDLPTVLKQYGEGLTEYLENVLNDHPDFVRVGFRWFPRALLVDINAGHLNLAEAVLDMAGGGPMGTSELLQQIGLKPGNNPGLVEFSLDVALQDDNRFDEVGPAGEVVWHLNRLEPEGVLTPPTWLRYTEMEYDRSLLNPAMQALERELDDELSPVDEKVSRPDEVQIRLIYPHWRAGTLPLSNRVRHLFPTAFMTPRIRFMIVDGNSGQKFPAWVVRPYKYVYGLREWYQSKGLTPGSLLTIRRGKQPGEVIVTADTRRPTKEYIRTVLVGSDGGTVFAMLKQTISSTVDERMAIVIPDVEALDQSWVRQQKERVPFEKTVVNIVRELARLNPQSHVHASELYAAVNIVRRCPPGPLLALLASRSWFNHVGDLHFRFDDSEK